MQYNTDYKNYTDMMGNKVKLNDTRTYRNV